MDLVFLQAGRGSELLFENSSGKFKKSFLFENIIIMGGFNAFIFKWKS